MKPYARALPALLAVSGFALMSHATSARAQTVEELQAQINELRAVIEGLKKDKDQRIEAQPVAAPRAQSASTQEAAQPPLKVEAKGAPRFSGDGFKNFKVRGRIMTDLGQVGNPDRIGTVDGDDFLPDRGLGTTSEVRRARIGVEGEITDWKYKFEADFTDNEVEAADAYLAYKGLDLWTITLGHQKTQASMEEQTSSLDKAFIARGTFTDAFAFGRELGATAMLAGDNWHWKSGVFVGGGFSGDDEDKGYVISSRGHYSFIHDAGFVHLGASVEYRDEGEQETRFRNRPVLHTTDTRLIDTGRFDAQSSFFAGAELAGVYGPLNFHGEYGTMNIDLADGGGNASLDGAFFHLGYFLTGEQRGYKAKDGYWSSTKPTNPLGKGGIGAWQLNLGLDWVNLNDRDSDIFGGEQISTLAGITWTPISHVRFIANYSHIEINNSATHVKQRSDGSLDNDFGLNAFGLRAQVNW